MDATLAGVLSRAKAFLSTEDRWIGHEYAADAEGKWIPVGSRGAVRFSLFGAIIRVGGADLLGAARGVFERVDPTFAARSRVWKLTYGETIALLDAAIGALADERPTLGAGRSRQTIGGPSGE